MKKVIAVIPCRNEELFISDVIGKTQKYCNRVVAVNNNSTDNTRVKLAEFLSSNDIRDCQIKGAGATTAKGINWIVNSLDGDVMITLDGDGQHDPNDIPRLVQPIIDDKADIVIGNRFKNYKTIPLYRRFGISLITYLYNFGGKTRVSDSQCGFRAFNSRALKYIMPIQEHGFAFAIEVLVKARAANLRIVEVPIECKYYKEFKHNSSMSPIRHGIVSVFAVLKWRLLLRS